MNREMIYAYAKETYQTTPEYLWAKYPAYAVLRHEDNRKWYAVIMNVTKDRLGLAGSGEIDIMDIKCDPAMIGSLRMTQGILPGYHMNKGNWVSVLLDGSVADETVLCLLAISHEITAGKRRTRE